MVGRQCFENFFLGFLCFIRRITTFLHMSIPVNGFGCDEPEGASPSATFSPSPSPISVPTGNSTQLYWLGCPGGPRGTVDSVWLTRHMIRHQPGGE